MAHFQKYMKGLDVQMEYMGDQQLLALQVDRCLCKSSLIFSPLLKTVSIGQRSRQRGCQVGPIRGLQEDELHDNHGGDCGRHPRLPYHPLWIHGRGRLRDLRALQPSRRACQVSACVLLSDVCIYCRFPFSMFI